MMDATTTAPPTRPAPSAPSGAPPSAGSDLGLGAVCAAMVAAATCWLVDVPTSHVAETAALYVVLAALVLRHLPPVRLGAGIGPANRVTLARATLVLPLAALALHPRALPPLAYAWIVALATGAMMLDGVDGAVARRTRTSSAFGARFDMELDAALLMALSVLAWQSGKIGSWVILIGGLRYLFVGAGLLWPVLQGDLPASLRRKTVCVWQGLSLLLALSPVTSPTLAEPIAGTAFALLVWSFAVDVRWLLAREAGA